MAVHRITDAAEAALKRIVQSTGDKPSKIISELIIDYERGLAFLDASHPIELTYKKPEVK